MPYRQTDDGPSSDATIEAWGTDLAELLTSAWRAALEVMIDDADKLPAATEIEVNISAADPEALLFDLLDELIFNKDARGLLLLLQRPQIQAEKDGYHLRAIARGEQIDRLHVGLGIDVKAVTFHQFTVQQSSEGWFARVVLDT